MPASERGLAKNQGAREAKIKSARKNQAPLDSTAQTGRQADNDRGRNHRGVEEGRQIRRGSGKRKTGARRANAPKMRGSRIEEQRHRRANGLRTALCLSAAKTGATGAVPLRRANDAARGKGGEKNKSAKRMPTHPPPQKKKTKSARGAGPRTAKTRPTIGRATFSAPGATTPKTLRCGAAALVYGLLHDVWAAARTHPPGRNLSFHVRLPGLGHTSHDQLPL